MKKNYILILFAIVFSGLLLAQETQKNYINYQGVARNASNELMAGETINIGIALKFGTAGGAVEYEENHSITTDANGVFSLLIGNGSAISGNYNSLPWGSAATFAAVSINGRELGTTEMMAVPYAISSGKVANQSADEVLYDNSTSGLSATTAQEAIDELRTSGGVDADADPSNEIQTLSFDPVSNELSLTDGGMVTIPSGGTDADADPANELQTLAFDSATNELSLSDGNAIIIPSGGVDGDGDATNEIQTLSFNPISNELSLSDGGVVTIPSGGTDADADPENEIDVTRRHGLLVGDDGIVDGLVGTIDGQVAKWDAALGNWVAGTDETGAGGGSSLWNEGDNGISRTSGQVGIGHQAGGDAKLFVQNTLPDIRNGIRASVFNNGYKVAISASAEARGEDANNTFGIRSSAKAESNGTAWAYRGDIGGTGTGRKYGLDLVFYDGTGGEKYGVYSKGENKNYFSGDLGLGIENPTTKLDVDGSIRSRGLSGSGRRNVVADDNGNLVIGTTGSGSSHWTQDGDDINYNSGNVGIGTVSPARPFHIRGDEDNSIRFESTTERNWVSYFNSSGYIGYAGIFTGSNDMDFGTAFLNGTGKVHLTTNAIPKLTVVPNGNVGIGTTNPTTKLEVDGDIKTLGEVHGPNTGSSNMIPIAYGTINRDGTIASGSGNFRVLTGSIPGYYSINIEGENYRLDTHITTATIVNAPGFLSIYTGTGTLTIQTKDIDGGNTQNPFSFVSYKN